MSIQRFPNGTCRAVVRYKGAKKNGPTRPTEDEARMDEARLLLELGGQPSPEALSVMTVGALVSEQLRFGKYSPSSVGPLTYAQKAMPEALRNFQADKLTTPALARFLDSMDNAEKRRKARNLISSAYKRGIRQGYVSGNPAAGLTVESVKAKVVVPPSVEQVAKLLEDAEKVNHALAVYFRLSAHLGCRRSEVIALQWSDLDDGSLLICRNVIEADGKLIVRATKTGEKAHRRLAVSEEVVHLLNGLERQGPWVFHHAGEQWRPGYVSLALTRLADGFTLHGLRHFTATQMFAQGRSVIDVAHRLGDSPATVLRTYAHYVPEIDRSVADLLPF